MLKKSPTESGIKIYICSVAADYLDKIKDWKFCTKKSPTEAGLKIYIYGI